MSATSATLEIYPALVGVGMALPERVVTNDEVAGLLDQEGIDGPWIVKRTGVETRHWMGDGETLAGLAAAAGKDALGMAGIDASELDDIYIPTGSGREWAALSFSSLVQGALGAPETCGVTDLGAACAGGVVSLRFAMNNMQEEEQSAALIIGAEKLTNILNLEEHGSSVLFADAAGGGVIAPRLGAIKPLHEKLNPHDPTAIFIAEDGRVRMRGGKVARNALYIMSTVARRLAQRAGYADPDDPTATIDWSKIDYVIPHQANPRLLETVGGALGVPEDKLITASGVKHGNTSSASIFLATTEGHRQGLIKPGLKTVMYLGAGAGMTGGGNLVSVDLPELP